MASFNAFLSSDQEENSNSNGIKLSTFQTNPDAIKLTENREMRTTTELPSLNNFGAKPKTLQTYLATDGSTKTTIFPPKTESNVSEPPKFSVLQKNIQKMNIKGETTSTSFDLPSLKQASSQSSLPSLRGALSTRTQETAIPSSSRLPSVRSRPQAPQKQSTLSSINANLPAAANTPNKLLSNSKWQIVGKKMNIGVQRKPKDIVEIIKLARAYQKARAGIMRREDSEKHQAQNMLDKKDKRKLAVMMLSCMIEADLPPDFYDKLSQSNQIKNIIKSFVASSDNTKQLLVTLCEEHEDLEGSETSGLSEASVLSEISEANEDIEVSKADVKIDVDLQDRKLTRKSNMFERV